MEIKIKFIDFKEIRTGRDATEMIFYYDLIQSKDIGLPEEKILVQHNQIYVSISGTLEACWMAHGLNPEKIYKVMFEYGKRYIKRKIAEGELLSNEKLSMLTTNVIAPECEFNPDNIDEPIGYEEII